MSEEGKVYLTTSLQPDTIDRIVKDDSPAILFSEFWPFLGVDIPIANLKEHDFRRILLKVRRQILNILERYPEDEWDNIIIVEKELVPKTDGEGNILIDRSDPEKPVPIMVERVATTYRILELLNSLDAKVDIKMCRARDGFTFNGMTVERQHIRQDVNDNRPLVMSAPQSQGETEKVSGWGL